MSCLINAAARPVERRRRQGTQIKCGDIQQSVSHVSKKADRLKKLHAMTNGDKEFHVWHGDSGISSSSSRGWGGETDYQERY